MNSQQREHVVIIGGGFGGLYAAKALAKAPVQITLIDRRNFHLFQPLLYQVATGGLSPGDITSPLRAVLSRQDNVRVLQAEMIDLDPEQQRVILRDDEISYDHLIVATGVSHHYFGKEDQWADKAPGLKTIEDALNIRRRILLAFEAAERESDPERRRAWLNFVVVGAGPTGVELAGALGELSRATLKDDFRSIDPTEAQIFLLEASERVLPPYPKPLSAKAEASLRELGVTTQTGAMVTDIQPEGVMVKQGDDDERFVPARTVLWAAGMKASPLGSVLARTTDAETDRAGRVMVNDNLSVGRYDNIFVIGDLAHLNQDGEPLPGVAQVAMQQGSYVAKLIRKRVQGETLPPFRYRDRGSMAVIGRNAAVADTPFLRFAGFPAWLAWVFIHIAYLVEYDNRLLVMFQWALNYVTRKRGARLITGPDPLPTLPSLPQERLNGRPRETEAQPEVG